MALDGGEEWKEGGGQMIHEKIREAIERVEGISGDLEHSHSRRRRPQIGGGGEGGGRAKTPGDVEALKSSARWIRGSSASVSDVSMKEVRDTLSLSMELLDAGESSTSANTAAMEDISAWLSNLGQRQQVSSDGGGNKTLWYALRCTRGSWVWSALIG